MQVANQGWKEHNPPPMKIFLFVFLIALFGAFSINAQNVDPDTQEQINAAKKQAEKMGVKMPDIDKMMEENAAEDAAAKTEATKKAAATKPEPLPSLAAWIPALDGFQAMAGSGKHWIDNDGK